MNSASMCDMQLEIKAQALAILAILSQRVPDFADYRDGQYAVSIKSRAWYNGRESGVSLEVQKDFTGPALFICFGECRSSDSIFIDWWVESRGSLNGPSVADFPDEAYTKRIMREWGRIDAAVGVIYDLCEAFYKEGAHTFCEKRGRVINEKDPAPPDPVAEDWDELKGKKRGRK